MRLVNPTPGAPSVVVDYCGEEHPLRPGDSLVIGRGGDLVVDDNPYLHRAFLRVESDTDGWWLRNIGSLLTATVADDAGAVRTTLGPGARVPLLGALTTVLFTAGTTTYEIDVHGPGTATRAVAPVVVLPDGELTIGPVPLTASQKQFLVALCEPSLRRGGLGGQAIPTTAQLAVRLSWTEAQVNRKLDNVCDKFDRHGVAGLRGGVGQLAVGRKARLVDHVLTARVVVAADLALLPPRS